jgi:hypothetical protein
MQLAAVLGFCAENVDRALTGLACPPGLLQTLTRQVEQLQQQQQGGSQPQAQSDARGVQGMEIDTAQVGCPGGCANKTETASCPCALSLSRLLLPCKAA